MKTREYIGKLTTGKWTRMTVLAIAAFIVFGYLYSRGVSPVWTAVAIVCFRGFFRFLYKGSLLPGGSGDTFLYPQLPGILIPPA